MVERSQVPAGFFFQFWEYKVQVLVKWFLGRALFLACRPSL
jgi:hypothetical protein